MAHSVPKVARIWRGRTTKANADEYHAYLAEGVKTLGSKALGVQMLREDRATETEFIVISYWESFEAMSRYSGSDASKIRHLPRDAELLIELPDRVQVLDIVSSAGNVGGGAA